MEFPFQACKQEETMICPNCHYSPNSTEMVKCSQCGKLFERGLLEELQHIDYLENWLKARQGKPGQAVSDWQAEIQVQRSSLEDRLGIQKVDLAQASRELALLQATYERVPLWADEAQLGSSIQQDILNRLDQQIVAQRASLRGLSALRVTPAYLEILDFALETLRTDESLASRSKYQMLLDRIETDRKTTLANLAREQSLEHAVHEFMPAWIKQSALDRDFSKKLEGLLCAKAESSLALLGGRYLPVKTPARLEVIEFAIQSAPGWAARLGYADDRGEALKLINFLIAEREALRQPASVAVGVRPGIQNPPIEREVVKPPAAVSQPPAAAQVAVQAAVQAPAAQVVVQAPAVAPAAPARPAAPPPPAKPRRPPIDWGKLWEKTVQAAVSGALLRGLLYLGAFMIVVSITILVIRFWDIFPTIVQLGFIGSVPTAFYAAGWFVRSRLRLPQAGNALSGVGALLVAVDLAAIYQIGNIPVAFELYWLVGGLVCTAIYSLTAWRLQGIFFDYVALLGGLNVLVALTRVLQLPLEWSIVAVMVGNGLMAFAATRLWDAGEQWRDSARAARYLPQVLVPASLVAILFFPGEPPAGQAAVFILATLSYGMLARAFPGAIFAHATVWCSVGAAGFSLRSLGLPVAWFGVAAAILSLPYTLASRGWGRRIPPDHPERRQMLLAPDLAGYLLLLAAMLIGLAALRSNYWVGVITLTLAALVLAFWAAWFRRPAWVIAAAGLFCAPVGLTVSRLLMDAGVGAWVDWTLAAFPWLALAYLGIAVLLRKADRYAAAMHLWAQVLPAAAGLGLFISFVFQTSGWTHLPALAGLAGILLVYLFSAIIHDSGKQPGLSSSVTELFDGEFGQAIFIWMLALLLPLWIGIAWYGSRLVPEWSGVVFAGLGLAYLAAGQFLMRRKLAYRLPLHAASPLLAIAGAWAAYGNETALMFSLYLDVVLLAGAALIYHSNLAIAAAAVLFVVPFELTLDLLTIQPHAQSLVYALLVCCAYMPLGLRLERAGRKAALPVYVVGYILSVAALAASLAGRFDVLPSDLPWVGVLTPAVIAGLYAFSLYRFRWPAFAWAAAATLVVLYGQLLTLLRVPPVYDAAAWAGLAYLYLAASWGLRRTRFEWLHLFSLPLGVGSAALGCAALALTQSATASAFFAATAAAQQPPVILAQAMVAALGILAAVLFRTRWPLYLVPWLAFLPVTLFFIGYGERLFGASLTAAQFGLVWSCLGLVNLIAAALLDPLQERYPHGLYLGGYGLALAAVVWTMVSASFQVTALGWSLDSSPALVWTLGLWVLICAASALSVHTKRHKTWLEVVAFVYYKEDSSSLHHAFQDLFLWLAAWLTPVWCVLLLGQFHLVAGYQWLGFSLSALAYLGLGLALRRLERAYAWPFFSAGQFFTALALFSSAPLTLLLLNGIKLNTPAGQLAALGIILVQGLAVLFYTLYAALSHQRLFAYLAAFLIFFPYTLSWIAFSALPSTEFSLPWMSLATLLLAAGFALDRRPERYSHGPYLAGYLLAAFALAWSFPKQDVTLYVLGWSILLALVSQLLVHFHRHAAYQDLLGWLFRSEVPTSAAHRAGQVLFLFFGIYAFPGWLTLLLIQNGIKLEWISLALALVAPLYLAAGLVLRRFRAEYTWPLYSAAYALTVIAALTSFGALLFADRLALPLTLVATVLALDAGMYAASAAIFRQAFWLYPANSLVPVIALLVLDNNHRLTAPWVAGAFMLLAFVDLGLGLWFDRRRYHGFRLRPGAGVGVSSYALPFYIIAYLLSALSLITSSSERLLAIWITLAGAALFAISAWAFRKSPFLYLAAWLPAVAYTLGMSLTSLPAAWYGVGWLPLIAGYILTGRLVFHKKPLEPRSPAVLEHPAMPFYLLAYALSLGMIVFSSGSALTLSVALAAGAVIYFGSAALFRRPAWLYPGLLATQLAVFFYLALQPSQLPPCYISLPFLAVTWITALAGYAFSRREPAARQTPESSRLASPETGKLDLAGLPALDYLMTPSWAQPFFIFAVLDVLIWQGVALFSFETAILVALGNAVLLGLFAMLWRDQALAYGALTFGLLAAGARLLWTPAAPAVILAWFGGIGLGLYLLGCLVDAITRLHQPKSSRLEIWLKPAFHLSIGLTGLAVIGTLPFLMTEMTAVAAALAFAGAMYLGIAYRGRHYRLGYLAVGMLEAAWVLALIARNVQQPQLYAIPAGLYFIAIGRLESRRSRPVYSQILVSLGLAIVLVTSFVQSIQGAQGFLYFVLLLAEGILLIWWGAATRQRIPFFAGLGASVLNVVAQVLVLINVYDVNRWFLVLGVGLALVVVAVFVERRRERLISRAQAWRDALESWS